MRILYEILNELSYSTENNFPFSYTMKETLHKYDVMPFVSANHPSQIYLVVKVYNSELANVLGSSFLTALAKEFRKQLFHRSEMDKNATLIIGCECKENESVDHLAKVQIEDDPYYFKKYIFSYSTLEEKRAEEYIQNLKNSSVEKFSFVKAVQSYLSNAEIFLSYKTNHSNQPTYTYFSELATKMPIFPLQIAAVDEIKSVTTFLSEELAVEAPPNINALDKLLELNLDFKEESVESILSHWNSIAKY